MYRDVNITQMIDMFFFLKKSIQGRHDELMSCIFFFIII